MKRWVRVTAFGLAVIMVLSCMVSMVSSADEIETETEPETDVTTYEEIQNVHPSYFFEPGGKTATLYDSTGQTAYFTLNLVDPFSFAQTDQSYTLDFYVDLNDAYSYAGLIASSDMSYRDQLALEVQSRGSEAGFDGSLPTQEEFMTEYGMNYSVFTIGSPYDESEFYIDPHYYDVVFGTDKFSAVLRLDYDWNTTETPVNVKDAIRHIMECSSLMEAALGHADGVAYTDETETVADVSDFIVQHENSFGGHRLTLSADGAVCADVMLGDGYKFYSETVPVNGWQTYVLPEDSDALPDMRGSIDLMPDMSLENATEVYTGEFALSDHETVSSMDDLMSSFGITYRLIKIQDMNEYDPNVVDDVSYIVLIPGNRFCVSFETQQSYFSESMNGAEERERLIEAVVNGTMVHNI